MYKRFDKNLSRAVRRSAEHDIQHHHEHEAGDHAPGAEVGIVLQFGVGDEVFGDDEEHCAGGEGEEPGLQHLDERSQEVTDECEDGFDNAARGAVKEGFDLAARRGVQRERDGDALGEILHRHAYREHERRQISRLRPHDGSRAEHHAGGEPFGDVVDGDGEEELCGHIDIRRVLTFVLAGAAVEVRDELIEDGEEDTADDYADGGGDPIDILSVSLLGALEGRHDERPNGRGDHYARRKPEYQSVDARRDVLLEKEHNSRARSRRDEYKHKPQCRITRTAHFFSLLYFSLFAPPPGGTPYQFSSSSEDTRAVSRTISPLSRLM